MFSNIVPLLLGGEKKSTLVEWVCVCIYVRALLWAFVFYGSDSVTGQCKREV